MRPLIMTYNGHFPANECQKHLDPRFSFKEFLRVRSYARPSSTNIAQNLIRTQDLTSQLPENAIQFSKNGSSWNNFLSKGKEWI
jgi:hypothetical protein